MTSKVLIHILHGRMHNSTTLKNIWATLKCQGKQKSQPSLLHCRVHLQTRVQPFYCPKPEPSFSAISPQAQGCCFSSKYLVPEPGGNSASRQMSSAEYRLVKQVCPNVTAFLLIPTDVSNSQSVLAANTSGATTDTRHDLEP